MADILGYMLAIIVFVVWPLLLYLDFRVKHRVKVMRRSDLEVGSMTDVKEGRAYRAERSTARHFHHG